MNYYITNNTATQAVAIKDIPEVDYAALYDDLKERLKQEQYHVAHYFATPDGEHLRFYILLLDDAEHKVMIASFTMEYYEDVALPSLTALHPALHPFEREITELYNGLDEYEMSNTSTKLVVGHSIGEFYINRFAGVNPANGDALWYDKEGNITNELRDEDKVLIGKSYHAPWQGGFGTSLSWKGLSLSAQFSWVGDRWMINNDRYFDESNGRFATYNQSRRLLNRWKQPGDITDIPRHGEYTEFDSRLLEDASFLRLKNVMLAYSPASFHAVIALYPYNVPRP